MLCGGSPYLRAPDSRQVTRTAERHERSKEAQAIKRSCVALKPASELVVQVLDRRLAARSMKRRNQLLIRSVRNWLLYAAALTTWR
eukprot:COSAG02_NODE_5383_length_4380_cov_79.127073_4_plen_86_part_00